MVPTVIDRADHASPRISVIVVSYNGRAYLERCLGSLLAESATDREVVLVDSASTDGSAAYVERAFPQVRLVRTTNGGYGHGCNVGARAAQGTYLAFLNQDTVVQPGWAEALVAALQRDPGAGLSTARILLLRDPERTNACGNDVHCTGLTLCRGLGAPADALREDGEVGAISGAAFAMSRHLFEQLGGFDERFGMYMEDTDLSLRARLAGYHCLYVSGAVVYHDYRLRFGPLKTYYQERNRYLMLLKHLRWTTLLALLPVLLLGEVVAWSYVLLREPHRTANKLRAYAWVAGHWREIVSLRQRVQGLRRTPDSMLFATWTCRLAFEQAGAGSAVQAAHALFDPLFRASWRVARTLVRRREVAQQGQASWRASSIAAAKATWLRCKSLLGSAACLLATDAIASLAGLLFWGAAARLYRPQQVGLASAVLAAVMLVSSIAGLGTSTGLARFLPQAAHPHRLLNSVFTLNGVCGLLVGSAYLAGAHLWSPSLAFVWKEATYAAGFVLFGASTVLGTAAKMAFVARRQAGYAVCYACILNLGRLLLLFPLCCLGAGGPVVAVGAACAAATALSLCHHLPRALDGYRPRPLLDVWELRGIVPYSLGSSLAGLLLASTRTVLPLLVVEALGPEASAYAYTALTIGALLAMPAVALATAALAEGARDLRNVQAVLRPATALAVGLALPSAGIAVVAATALLLPYGAGYAREGASLLRWLALAAPLTALKELRLARLRVEARIGRLIAWSAACALLTLGLSAALMPRLGIAGIGPAVLAGEGLLALPAAASALRGQASRAPVRASTGPGPLKIALVCSHGGHLSEMELLGPAFEGHRCFLVTYRSPRTEALSGRRYLLPNIGTSPWRLLGAFARAAWVLGRERPDVVLSTGSEIAIPFLWLGRLLGARTVYVESCCRVTAPSRTGPLVYPVSDLFLVQWPALLERYGPRAQYVGGLM